MNLEQEETIEPTTLEEPQDDFVELKAHIVNLVSALGGPDLAEESEPYVLGDDALGCLRDLKRWLKVYDEQNDSLDVARAISETSLVTFDLLEILTQWDIEEEQYEETEMEEGDQPINVEDDEDEEKRKKKYLRDKKTRIALACLELLVPLTWPISLTKTSNPNHFIHMPYLEVAYLKYKNAILAHSEHRIFRAVIHLCLPALSTPENKRTLRHRSTLKLAVYFLRNIFRINYRDNMDNQFEQLYLDTSRNTEVQIMKQQGVLDFLNALSSNISVTEFPYLNTPLMECLYYLLYGIDASVLFESTDKIILDENGQKNDLKSLLSRDKAKENNLKSRLAKRTNRSSSLVTIKDSKGDTSAVILRAHTIGTADALDSIDEYKTKRLPKLSNHARMNIKSNVPGADNLDRFVENQWNVTILLTKEVRGVLREFCCDFLQMSFNPLFKILRNYFENEWMESAGKEFSNIVQYEHQIHFLYLASSFLRIERTRLAIKFDQKEDVDFGLVAEVLIHNMFIIVMKMMRVSIEARAWAVVYTSMRCFNEIILTTNEMERIGDEETREIADNMKHRLFYLEEWLNTLAGLPVAARSQNESFVNLVVEVSYNVLSTLERFTKKNKEIYIQAGRRRRQVQKKNTGEENDEEMDEEAEAMDRFIQEKRYNERKLDFAAFQRKYLKEDTVEMLTVYLSNYEDLSRRQIKWGLSLTHRFFVTAGYHVGFFRLDFMRILDRLLESRAISMDLSTEFERFNKFFMRTLTSMLEKTPSLQWEILFHKEHARVFYLENGVTVEDTRASKPKVNRRIAGKVGLPMQFLESEEYTAPREHRFRILVAALIDSEKRPLLKWAIKALEKAYDTRLAWISSSEVNNDVTIEEEALNPRLSPEMDNKAVQEIEIGLRKNGTFRLLLKECQLRLDDNVDRTLCMLPRNALMETVKTCLDYMKRFNNEGTQFPDGKLAVAYLEEIKPAKKRAGVNSRKGDDSGDEEGGGVDDDLDGFIERDSDDESGSEDDGSSEEEAQESGAEGGASKKKRRRKSSSDRRRKHKKPKKDQQELPLRRRPIVRRVEYKSSEFITESDDEDDAERDHKFFEREAEQRIREKAKMDLLLKKPQAVTEPSSMEQSKKNNPSQDSDLDNMSEEESNEPENESEEEEPIESDNEDEDIPTRFKKGSKKDRFKKSTQPFELEDSDVESEKSSDSEPEEKSGTESGPDSTENRESEELVEGVSISNISFEVAAV